MSIEWIAASVLGISLLAAVGASIHRQIDTLRRRRLRTVASLNMYVERCWRVVDNVPAVYLPPAVRRVLVKLIGQRVRAGLTIDRTHKQLLVHEERLEVFTASLEQQSIMTRPNMKAAERKHVSRQLRDLKALCRDALSLRVVNRDEYVESRLVIDALLLRLLVDHLKINAENAEALGQLTQGLTYLQRARTELAGVDKAVYAEEISDIDDEIVRLQRLSDPEWDKRTSEAEGRNALLEAFEAESQDSSHWQKTVAAEA